MALPALPHADLMTQARYLKTLPAYQQYPIPILLRQILAYRQSGLLISTHHLNFGKIPAFQKSVRVFYVTMRQGEKYSSVFDILPRGVNIKLERRDDLLKVMVQITVQLGDFRGSVQIVSPYERKTVLVSAVGEVSVENLLLECSMNELEATWRPTAEQDPNASLDDEGPEIAATDSLDLHFVQKINSTALSDDEIRERLLESQTRVAEMYGLEVETIQRQFRYERRGSVEKMVDYSADSVNSSADGSKRRWEGVGDTYVGCRIEIGVVDWFFGLRDVLREQL